MKRFLLTVALLVTPLPQAAAATAAVQEAVAALQHQDYKTAELKLRAELKLHPTDAETLSLLGISLDEQQLFTEAREFHKRAMAADPRSTAVLYNYANNLLATGDEKTAREILLKSSAVDPSDPNTNLALTQLAINRKDGHEALSYLEHLKDAPEAPILRLAALDLTDNRTDAAALFEQLSAAARNDAKLNAEYARILEKAGQFDQAETLLTHALASDPANFQLLYHLGAVASQAGHNDRARTVLESARRMQPKNVDVLYSLALVNNALSQPEPAIRLLAEAAVLAPQRADVQKLTAITARNMTADEDSVAAWERYLKLVPTDDEARRERAFAKARLTLLDEALPDLRAYVARHPDDPVGYYELGMAESVNNPARAIATLDHAIALKPDLVAARAGRGILLYTQNKPEAAVTDLEFVVSQIPPEAPERAAMLDRLGQTYLMLNRLKDAVPALRQAAALAPTDATALLHLANALAEAGQTAESDALMARFRQMSPGGRVPKLTGVVDYLSRTPEQQHDLYKSRLEKVVHDHPEDEKSQILYLKLLLADSQMAQAAADARTFAARKPQPAALADAGHALLAASQYSSAIELLTQAATSDSSTGIKLDLAIATFHSFGAGAAAAESGLDQLDRIPGAARDSGYYVARAQMLEVTGKPVDAIAAMNQALAAAPGDTGLYWQTAVLMTRNQRPQDALRLLDKAPADEAEIPVIKAAILELSGKTDDARHLLNDAQHRWPEVPAVWVAQGLILAAHGQTDAARRSLETAVALGAHSPETYYALAQSTLGAGPEHGVSALKLEPGYLPENELANPSKLFLERPPQDW